MIGKVSHQIGKMCWYFRRTQGVLLHLALPYLACRLHYDEQLCDFMYEICTSVQSANIRTEPREKHRSFCREYSEERRHYLQNLDQLIAKQSRWINSSTAHCPNMHI